MKRFLFAFSLCTLAFASVSAGAADARKPKVLIVYYSLTGNTDYVAKKLQERTGGDLFRLETVRTYPSERPGLTEEPKKELETGNLPELKALPKNLADYDLILVGSPVWWYTVSTPVMRFLKEADFQGRKVAPFCTHGGGLGNFFTHFRQQAKNARVLEGFEIYKPKNNGDVQVNEALATWLGGLR